MCMILELQQELFVENFGQAIKKNIFKNMDLEKDFREDLHGGKEEKEGMQRFNGYYIGQENGFQTILFDNGNMYFLDAKTVVKKINKNDVYFIDEHIIEAINDFIIKNSKMTENYTYTNSNYNNQIEIYGNSRDKKQHRHPLIKMVINRQSENIEISNIMMPMELRYNGFGKGIIKAIFEVVQIHNYKLYLVQMVESFYDRMIKRGAKEVSYLDIVEITIDTKL